jgi:predicted dehydrogenase
MKTALIGTGQIAQQHLACLSTLPETSVAAVCDLSRAMAESAAERFGVHSWFTNHSAMLDAVRPDVVHITTPPQSHFRLAMDSLAAGAHVIVEKPLTAAADQVAVLLRSASEAKRILVEDYNYLFNAPIRRIMGLVQSGELGAIVEIEVKICLDLLTGAFVPDAYLSVPGGAIADFLPHLASVAHSLVGPHRSVRSHWSKHSADSPLPFDKLHAIVVAERGTAVLGFSACAQPDAFSVRVSGTRLHVSADLFDDQVVINRPDRGPRPIARLRDRLQEARDVRRATLRNFGRKLLHGPGTYDGMWTLLARTYESLKSGAEPPITRCQIAEVNAMVTALTAEEFRF